jgi:cytochrome c-type biogenesis protein
MSLAETPGVAIPIVFLAGIASFLSPCVLPLVPGYLSYMGGLSVAEGARSSPRLLAATGSFVAGFSTIFLALGMSASLIGSFLAVNQTVLVRVAGVLIVLMGLAFLGLIPLPWIYREKRFQLRPAQTVPGSYVMGLAFGFGWTPCIGPALAAALAIAATEQTPGRGALLLSVYALGLGVPFVLSAVGVARLTAALSWFRRHQWGLSRASGFMLVAVGVLFVFNRIFVISSWVQRVMTASGLDFWNNL